MSREWAAYKEIESRLRTSRWLFVDNLRRRWMEWRNRRAELRDGVGGDILSRFHEKGWR